MINATANHWRSLEFVLGPENRGAEVEVGGEGWGWEGNIPIPCRVYAYPHPSRGSELDRRKRVLVHFELEKNKSGDDEFDSFCRGLLAPSGYAGAAIYLYHRVLVRCFISG